MTSNQEVLRQYSKLGEMLKHARTALDAAYDTAKTVKADSFGQMKQALQEADFGQALEKDIHFISTTAAQADQQDFWAEKTQSWRDSKDAETLSQSDLAEALSEESDFQRAFVMSYCGFNGQSPLALLIPSSKSISAVKDMAMLELSSELLEAVEGKYAEVHEVLKQNYISDHTAASPYKLGDIQQKLSLITQQVEAQAIYVQARGTDFQTLEPAPLHGTIRLELLDAFNQITETQTALRPRGVKFGLKQ